MSDVKSKEELEKMWAGIQNCVESMKKDLEKNLNKNNSAAGRRVRAQLRVLKKRASELIRGLVNLDKQQG